MAVNAKFHAARIVNMVESEKAGAGAVRCALVLQGGGALGAYQAGVYQALEERGFAPEWVLGTSIGAINGGLIAGNPPGRRVARLREFWELVSSGEIPFPAPPFVNREEFYGALAVTRSMVAGRPGFFRPRLLPPFLTGSSLCERASLYDTTPLWETLNALVDFDLLNDGPIRISVGAVKVASGTLRYFDNRKERLETAHLMASGALPPGFPAVRIEGEAYWDGGIYSNTPLDALLDDPDKKDTLCFFVALFNPSGSEPGSIPEVETRLKEITYGTRMLEHVQVHWRLQNLRRSVRALYALLPEDLQKDPEILVIADLGCRTITHVVELIYPSRPGEQSHRDADFSRAAVMERWELGYADACATLDRKPWLDPFPQNTGLVVHAAGANGNT